MAHNVDLAHVGEVRPVAGKPLRHGRALHVAPRQRKPAAALAALLPQQRLVQDQAGGSLKFRHDCTSRTKVSKSSLGVVSVAQNK